MTSRQTLVLVVAIVFSLGLFVLHGSAASDPSPRVVPLRARVAKLERQVRVLSAKVEKLEAAVCPQFPPVCSPIPKEKP